MSDSEPTALWRFPSSDCEPRPAPVSIGTSASINSQTTNATASHLRRGHRPLLRHRGAPQLAVEFRVAHRAVEALDLGVLLRAALFDEDLGGAQRRKPASEATADEPAAIV